MNFLGGILSLVQSDYYLRHPEESAKDLLGAKEVPGPSSELSSGHRTQSYSPAGALSKSQVRTPALHCLGTLGK